VEMIFDKEELLRWKLGMPRQPRLDAPGTLHHVIGRGIEKTKIFREDGN